MIIRQQLDQVASTESSTDLLTSLSVRSKIQNNALIIGHCYYTMHICFILDDDNRIILRPIEGHSDCQRDFINACYVDVGLFAHKYLCLLLAINILQIFATLTIAIQSPGLSFPK